MKNIIAATILAASVIFNITYIPELSDNEKRSARLVFEKIRGNKNSTDTVLAVYIGNFNMSNKMKNEVARLAFLANDDLLAYTAEGEQYSK